MNSGLLIRKGVANAYNYIRRKFPTEAFHIFEPFGLHCSSTFSMFLKELIDGIANTRNVIGTEIECGITTHLPYHRYVRRQNRTATMHGFNRRQAKPFID